MKVNTEQSDELDRQVVQSSLTAQKNLDSETKNRYECEVCHRVDECTEEEAHRSGWDYPPFIGAWGIISPRTCPGCTIEKTAYWFIMMRSPEDETPIPENHIATIKRILAEEGESDAAA